MAEPEVIDSDEGTMSLAERPAVVVRGERFDAAREMNPWALMKLSKAMKSKDSQLRSATYLDFVNSLLDRDERERFDAYLMDLDPPIGMDELDHAVGDVMVAISGRPTERPSSSEDGPTPTGRSSRVVSFSEGTDTGKRASSKGGRSAVS